MTHLHNTPISSFKLALFCGFKTLFLNPYDTPSVRPNRRTTETNRTETGIGSVRFGSVDFTETTEPTEPAETYRN